MKVRNISIHTHTKNRVREKKKVSFTVNTNIGKITTDLSMTHQKIIFLLNSISTITQHIRYPSPHLGAHPVSARRRNKRSGVTLMRLSGKRFSETYSLIKLSWKRPFAGAQIILLGTCSPNSPFLVFILNFSFHHLMFPYLKLVLP